MDIRQQEMESAEKLRAAASERGDFPPAVVGLDGFIDEIVHVVHKREGAESFERMESMKGFAERVESASGKSANIELVPHRIKIGGNGPIMANTLQHLGAPITYIGNLGYPDAHPIFRGMAERCRVFSLAEPAHTDAMEFNDGKIMLGKMDVLREITWERILEVIGLDRLVEHVDESRALALVNWTMVPYSSEIWEKILTEVCPRLSNRERFVFFDLADPEKRTTADIERMLELVRAFNKPFKAIFGLNERESHQIARILGGDSMEAAPAEKVCEFIASKMDIHCVIVHPVKFAAATSGGITIRQDGPNTDRPVITTGAGDHFNAAFCLGSMLGLDAGVCLLMGVCCSGHYVMSGRTPSLDDLVGFMKKWRDNPFNR